MLRRSIFFLLSLSAMLALSQCNTMQSAGTSMQAAGSNGFRFAHRVVTGEIPRATRFVTGKVKRLLRLERDGSFWNADEFQGKPSLLISLSEQMVYLFKGG